MSPLAWAFLLLFAAFGLLVIEMFVPSHGVIGSVAAVMVAASVVAGFYQNVVWGVVMLAISAVSVPFAVWAVFLYWPQTPIGQRILIKLPESPEEFLPKSYQDNKTLIGKVGVARSKMLLAGAIEIEGKFYDAVSEDLPIETGAEVQVVAVKMNRIIVRGLDPNRPRESSTPPIVNRLVLAANRDSAPSDERRPMQSTASNVIKEMPAVSEVATPVAVSPDDLLARSAASFGLDDLPELASEAEKKEGDSPKPNDS